MLDNQLHNNIIKVLDNLNILNRCYFVGGLVRDHFLGIQSKDIDIVFEKPTIEDINRLNNVFKLTGKDFPVYGFNAIDSNNKLHTIDLAVARIEKKIGNGHNGFSVEYGKDIDLFNDLSRRDLTINAIAIPVNDIDKVIDPFNGLSDLDNRIIRHVSNAFQEDPLRVFRVARFAAKFNKFGFIVDQSTKDLCREINEATLYLSNERILIEVINTLTKASKPSIFFEFLKETDNLKYWFPELFKMIDLQQPELYHGNKDVFQHTLETLDNARQLTDDENILLGALFHDIGKILTPLNILPKHHNHEENGLLLVDGLSKRLRLSSKAKQTIIDAIKNHMRITKAIEMNDGKLIKLINQLKRNDTFHSTIAIAHADRLRDNKGGIDHNLLKRLHQGHIALSEKLNDELVDKLKGKRGDVINEIITQHRVKLLREISK